MVLKERTAWGIHAGKTGDADTLFIEQNCVAIGWPDMGNLSELPDKREAFKNRMTERHPAMKSGTIRASHGQLYRFIYEMKLGDIVIYPSKRDRIIHIGEVKGAYRYNIDHKMSYPHQRSVKWLKKLPRTNFTQGALYEIGSALSFFQVKDYIDEFLAVIESKTTTESVPVARDETVALVAEEIEQTTRDFILKTLSQELKGHPFAEFVAHLLNTMGYRTRVSPPGPDSGIDIVAHKDELGFEPPIIKVQVKSNDANITPGQVQALNGNVDGNKGEFGLFVALSSFTSAARTFARGKSNLRLIDGEELVDLILEHYEDFESRYKALLPLKRVYVPQILTDEE